ncbi:hypothetical protein JXA12_02090 [Candidatus Woesearchaeota archaeon]|nr:hypothetical protein [Candidatus Woesearchaeota archaeon]
MDVVLIGVSDRTSLWRHGSLQEKDYPSFVQAYARLLAKHFDNVIVTPDDGVYTDIADAYGKIKHKKPIAYYPDKDTTYGYGHLHLLKYDARPIRGDWYTLNADLTKQAPIVICLGFSPGTLIELSYIKYHQKYAGKDIKLLIDERCIERRLPRSFEEQLRDISYYDDLEALEFLLARRDEASPTEGKAKKKNKKNHSRRS